MFKEIKFFRLNPETCLPEIGLGNSIDELINSGIVEERINNGESEYLFSKDENVRIGVESGLVKFIFFVRESGWDFFKFDPFSFTYPATESITEHFSRTHEYLSDIETMEELKLQLPGDYLILIFSDFIPNHITLMRIN